MDASFFRETFSKALKITQRWSAEQSRCETILTSLLEFHGRMALLEDPDTTALRALAGEADAVELLHAKHVRGLENLMRGLREGVGRFEALHGELGELHADVWKRLTVVQQERRERLRRPAPRSPSAADEPALHESSWDVVGAGCGNEAQHVLLPPPLLCVEWLGELDALYGAELHTKLQLVDAAHLFGEQASRLRDVAKVWALQPHLSDSTAVERLRELVDSLSLTPTDSFACIELDLKEEERRERERREAEEGDVS